MSPFIITGCGTWIRTKINGFRVHRATVAPSRNDKRILPCYPVGNNRTEEGPMFREPLDDLREDVLEDLETYVWGHLFSLVDERKNPSIKNAALAHLLLAYNPEFVEKLVISAGISARELQKLLDSVVVKFAQCLMISLQHAFINEPLRLDSLI